MGTERKSGGRGASILDAAPGSTARVGGTCAALLAAVALFALPVPGRAQTARTLDEGSFDISIAGRHAGRETFVIRREGAAIKAVGVVSLDSARPPFVPEQVWLQTDSMFRPELFQLKPRTGDVHNVVAHRDGPRLRLQTTSDEGNRSRQFVASPGLALLEPGIAHEYYVFFREHAARSGGSSWSTSVVVPSLGEQATVQVRSAGSDSILAAGQERAATRYEVTLDGERIQVWLDDQGRVLQVRRPDHQWTATRSSMTR
ncbi:MAG: hypothetical protein Q8W51_10535 [Candidatus Palauibacterales bacterium]|nr:hypothetical protein [Candidatus Palauibacterales bacterium]MDP2530163.1 hypothetical protein [Candidatus Palauibacterales bacterium]MDP2582526.1 hypothetical protein [Candidatus Palauibacterales bacterium]